MEVTRRSTTYRSLAVFVLAFITAIAAALAQDADPSQSPSPTLESSPTVTPAATRVATQTPTPLPGARDFHQWGSITVFNGLPSDTVRAIAQTPDGVMWFGTDNGLAGFDGRRIQNFSLGNNESDQVLALKTATSGHLWIGTRLGAFVYTENGFENVAGTDEMAITSILMGSQIFLSTDAGIVLRTTADNDGTLRAERIFSDPILASDGTPAAITSLIESGNVLIFGTAGNGLFKVDSRIASSIAVGANLPVVTSLTADQAGRTWIGTESPRSTSGIYSGSGNDDAVRINAPTSTVSVLHSNESGVWAGTERFGLFHFEGTKLKKTYTFENTSGGLRSDNIFSLYTDREGVLWIGTNRGVSRFDRFGPQQQPVSDIPNSNFIRTIYQARGPDDRLYAGSNRGLFYKGKSDDWIEISALRYKPIYAIKQRADNSLLIGTPEGMFDTAGKRLFGGDIRSIASLNGRDYAAIYGRGVVDVADDQRLIYNDPLTSSVYAMPGKLWIGTSGNGLFSYDGKTVKAEAGPDILKSGTIWNMFLSENGTLYIAGQHGVFSFRDGAVEQICAVEDVRDVVERDGHIWAATTTKGLLHARRDDRFGWLVASIGFEQGMPSEKAFWIHTDRDALVIATNRGIVTYTPRPITPKILPTRILSQRIHDLKEVRSNIELDYPQNGLLIEVTGQSSRTFAEEFQYSFLLANAKGDMIDSRLSGEPQFIPADLKPGDYTVEAVAYDRDLVASEPLTVRFSIGRAPFPWTATALGVLLAIAVLAFIWAMVERKRIVERNRELAAARFDLANEAERERGRIARDLHDQTLADLRSLMMKSDQLSPPVPAFRAEIESVSSEIRRICEDLSPSVLENVGLIASLEFLLSGSISNYTFAADDDLEERIGLPLKVKLQIYRVVQEILSNIKRHSNADSVAMKVELIENGQLRIKISDNGGSFIPAAATGNGRGISNIRSRANIIGAKIAWKERKNGGNAFSLTLDGAAKKS